MSRFRHVLATVFGAPWAIDEDVFHAIAELVELRADGGRFTPEEVEARTAGGPGQGRGITRVGPVAVLPMYGVITPRSTLMSSVSGGTSLQELGANITEAAQDPSVASILLDVNSPGGSTALVQETAARIRAARDRKPVVAVANTIAGSAAYWLAAQATEVVVTPSGAVGSIGVFTAHEDRSAELDAAGVKTTLIHAGRFKVEGNPLGPLDDEGRAAAQAVVDDFYAQFIRDVARGRQVGVDAVRGGFGEGRMVLARQAVAAGMADRVDTLEATLGRLVRQRGPAVGRSSSATLDELEVVAEAGDAGHAIPPEIGEDITAAQDAEEPSPDATLRAFLLTKKIQEVTSR